MNKRQTEVEKKKLAEEAKELNHLKAIYNKAAEDIAKNISITDGKIEVMLQNWDDLSADDRSVYQSKIYQKNFQKQLQSQINGILKDLNSGQYKSIDEYLKKCYETGYVGTMYDIAGQGIPIITPIDQKKVITAMKTNSKISSGLYAKLGEDVQHLQKRIANNISRGIATSDSYENIARNIANASNVGMNNAMRIARTEGHRIHSNSAHDAQLAAKDAGADIVKQWDSTMDGNTRTTHRLLDGQIREVEEPFEMGGMKAMYPSDFGRPEEDINCRCALLQRATWALDDDELEALKEKAKFHEIYVEDDDKETFRKQKDIDLNTFTQRYLKATTTPTKTAVVESFRSFETGQEANEFFYWDSDTHSFLEKKKSMYGQWKKGLTQDQKDAISYYAADGYFDLNQYLRKYGNWEDINAEMVKELKKDLEDAISGFELKESIKVYRAIQPDAFSDYADDLQQLIGSVYNDKGFMSTSPTLDSSAVNKDCIMEILIPKGKGRGAYINELAGQYVDVEYEFLLPADSKFKILGVEEKDGKINIKMEMIVDE